MRENRTRSARPHWWSTRPSIRLGMMQYPETLPLADHEVVLTFDDGPLPPYTTRARRTRLRVRQSAFFLVGQMAKAHLVRCARSRLPDIPSARMAIPIRSPSIA
jgi:hypothetical protein